MDRKEAASLLDGHMMTIEHLIGMARESARMMDDPEAFHESVETLHYALDRFLDPHYFIAHGPLEDPDEVVDLLLLGSAADAYDVVRDRIPEAEASAYAAIAARELEGQR